MTPFASRTTAALLLVGAILSGCAAAPPELPPPAVDDDPHAGTWSDRWITPSAYAHYIEARVHHESGRLEQALGNIDLALVFDDQSSYLHAYRAELLLAAEEPDQARKALARSLDLHAEQPYAHYIAARLADAGDDLDAAIDHASRAVALDPDSLEMHQALIDLLLRASRQRDALTQLDDHLARWPEDPWGHLTLGTLALELGQHELAIDRFASFVDLRPRLIAGYHRLGHAYRDAGRLTDAYDTYVDCTRTHASAPSCWLQRVATLEALSPDPAALKDDIRAMAEALGQREQTAQATCSRLLSAGHLATLEAFVEHAVQLNPRRRELHFYIGLGHLRGEERASAARSFEEVPEWSALYMESRAKMAIALSELSRHAEATAALNQALRHAPETVQLWSLKAALQERAGRHREALQTLEEAVERFPAQADLHERVAAVAWELKMPRRTRAALERKLELVPDDIHSLNFLGYVLAEQGTQLPRAESLLKRAMTLRGQPDGTLSDSLGWIYHRMGRHADAIHHLEAAVGLLPGEPRIEEHLGDAYHANGQVDLALAHYRRALENTRHRANQAQLRRKIKTLSASR
ncbi:MAG: hypothetical protein CMH57_08780 [Myxococcales bacterium]|nr:hypothetical protein [Myxococcales bacterium]